MSAIQLATAYISLVVEAKGVAGGVAKELGAVARAADQAGAEAGKRLATAFDKNAKTDTKQLQAALDAAKKEAEKASAGVTKARAAQEAATKKAADAELAHVKTVEAVAKAQAKAEDAARKVTIAEKALAEVKAKHGADSSRTLAAEDRLIVARRHAEDASKGVETALRGQEAAQKNLTQAQRKAEAAAHGVKAATDAEKRALDGVDNAMKAVGRAADSSGAKAAGFGQKLKTGLRSGLSNLNPFKGLKAKAEREGRESADGFSSKFTSGVKGLGGKISGLIGPALAGIGVAAIGKGAFDIVGKAGDLEQSIGAIDTIFKSSSDQMHAWAASAADAVGLSRNEFNELGTLIGAQLKNGGLAMDKLAPKTNELISLGSDLSSMFGGTTREAVEALSSALKGERDPIERYGVSLTQAAIDAKAAQLGFQKVGGTLSAEANQAATLALIMEQTTDAHGNFAKESDTYAHKTQVLAKKWEDFSTGLGQKLMPVAMNVLDWLSGLGPAIDPILGSLGNLGNLLFGGDFTGPIFGIEEDNPLIGILFDVRQAVLDAVGVAELLFTGNFSRPLFGLEEDHPAIGALFDLRQGVQDTIGLAEMMFTGDFSRPLFGMEEDHPAIGALLQIRAGFESLGAAFGQLMAPGAGVSQLLAGISSGAAQLWDGIATHLLPILAEVWTSITGAVTDNLPALQQGLGFLGSAFDTVGGIASAVAALISQAWGAISPYVMPVITGLVTFLTGAFSSISQMIDGAMRFIQAAITGNWDGAWRAVKQIWDGAGKFLSGAWDWLKKLAGSVFGAIKDGVVGAWKSLSGGVKDATNGLKAFLTEAWEGLKKTVVGFADGMWKGVQGAFEQGKKAAGEIFDGLKELAKAPIKFVIETVVNKGIIGGVNWLAEKVGLGKPLKEVPLPSGFARGGILPGTSSWRDGDDQLVPMRRGEGVYISEVMRDPFERRRLYEMNRAAMRGIPLSIARDRIDGHDHGFATGGIVSFRGHRFTSLFASRIQAAERIAGAQMHISQGGFRPRTSYSGTSHAGDALDITGSYHRFIAPLRMVQIPTWDRAGKGNWVAHAHGVPLPGAGSAGGSAIWQAQDYLRGGDGLGGRDNGPRVSVNTSLVAPSPEAAEASKGWLDKAWDFIAKAGQAAWDFFTAPLKMFNEAIAGFTKFIAQTPGGKFGEIAANSPKILIQGIKDWVADLVGIPHFADGGYTPGGLALVGERGPELVELPRGSYVHPNHHLPRLRPGARNDTAPMHVTLTIPEAALRDLEALVEFLRRLPLAARRAGWQVS